MLGHWVSSSQHLETALVTLLGVKRSKNNTKETVYLYEYVSVLQLENGRMEKLRGPVREYLKQQVAASRLRKSDTFIFTIVQT